MPIYDYLCTACDHRADILHGINDPGPNFCPSCGSEGTMRKQFAAPAIHFKGSGWAKKDRGGSGASTRASAKAAAAESDRAPKPAGEGGASPSAPASSSDASPAASDASKSSAPTD
jgi:putative FmdB family regulatory protein